MMIITFYVVFAVNTSVTNIDNNNNIKKERNISNKDLYFFKSPFLSKNLKQELLAF